MSQQGRNGESTPGFQNGGAGASGSAGTSGGIAPAPSAATFLIRQVRGPASKSNGASQARASEGCSSDRARRKDALARRLRKDPRSP